MKLDELYEMWAKDCEIDPTELAKESIKIAQLHNRYLRIYSDERIILLRLHADMKILKKEKHTFYLDGPTKETVAKGWILPPKGTISTLEPVAASKISATSPRRSMSESMKRACPS